jgi:hypothetical protein
MMFRLNGPILAGVRLGATATETLRQAAAMAKFHGVSLKACDVLPDIFSVHPMFPHLNLAEALRFADAEAAARRALAERVNAAVAQDESPPGLITLAGGILSAALSRRP